MLCLNTCITHTHRPPASTHRLNPVLYYLPSCAPTSQPLIVTTFRQILFLLFTATHERAHSTCVSKTKMSLNIMSSSSIVLLKTDRMSFPLMTAYYTTMNIYIPHFSLLSFPPLPPLSLFIILLQEADIFIFYLLITPQFLYYIVHGNDSIYMHIYVCARICMFICLNT